MYQFNVEIYIQFNVEICIQFNVEIYIQFNLEICIQSYFEIYSIGEQNVFNTMINIFYLHGNKLAKTRGYQK